MGAANTIGGQSFAVMRGRPQPPGQIPQIIPRAAGENWGRYRLSGKAAPDATIATVSFHNTAEEAKDAADADKLLQGTSVAVTSADLIAYENCMVLAVRPLIVACVRNGTKQWSVRCIWTVRQGDPAG